jgi:hypothetical protein
MITARAVPAPLPAYIGVSEAEPHWYGSRHLGLTCGESVRWRPVASRPVTVSV